MQVLNGQSENLKKLTMDEKSIGLCLVTFITKIFADVMLSDIGNLITIGVGLTTIAYNIYRIKNGKDK